MATLFIMCGLSFSGKTTLAQLIARATSSAVVSYDDLYATVSRDPALIGIEEWRFVMERVEVALRTHLAAGRNVIVDTLNEERADRDRWRAAAADVGASAVVVYVVTPLDVIHERRRGNEAAPVRGRTSSEQFRFVEGRFLPPTAEERTVRYVLGDDPGGFIERLLQEMKELAP